MKSDAREIRNMVLGGLIVIAIPAAIKAIWSPIWAAPALWVGGVIGILALLAWASVRTYAAASRKIEVVLRRRKSPVAALPAPDCQVYDPGTGVRDFRWPKAPQFRHFDYVEVTLQHAAVPSDASQYAGAGIEFEAWKGPVLCVYIFSTGQVTLFEGAQLKFVEQIPKDLQAGLTHTLRLERDGQTYSVYADGDLIWGNRSVFSDLDATGPVNLWPDQVSARVRLHTNDPDALVTVFNLKGEQRKR